VNWTFFAWCICVIKWFRLILISVWLARRYFYAGVICLFGKTREACELTLICVSLPLITLFSMKSGSPLIVSHVHRRLFYNLPNVVYKKWKN
jgi:hypothetical protein